MMVHVKEAQAEPHAAVVEAYTALRLVTCHSWPVNHRVQDFTGLHTVQVGTGSSKIFGLQGTLKLKGNRTALNPSALMRRTMLAKSSVREVLPAQSPSGPAQLTLLSHSLTFTYRGDMSLVWHFACCALYVCHHAARLHTAASDYACILHSHAAERALACCATSHASTHIRKKQHGRLPGC